MARDVIVYRGDFLDVNREKTFTKVEVEGVRALAVAPEVKCEYVSPIRQNDSSKINLFFFRTETDANWFCLCGDIRSP